MRTDCGRENAAESYPFFTAGKAWRARIAPITATDHTERMATPRKKDALTEPSSAEIAAVREGREDLAAGRHADHRTVAEWLRTWGDKKRKPPPTDKP